VRVQLSMLLRTVVSQQLLVGTSGKVVPAFEIMHVNSAIRTLIRESKTHQIDNIIQTSAGSGMVGMDSYIMNLVQTGQVAPDVAVTQASNPDQMAKRLNR
jgi:twitching motility protein PilT